MKIGYEAKRIFKNYTGLGNYARYVVQIIANYYPSTELFLYTPKTVINNRTRFSTETPGIKIKTASWKVFRSLWRSFGLVKDLRRDQIDIFHGLSNEIPYGLKNFNIPSVVTIHDLIFLRYPAYFKYIDRKIYYLKFKSACKNANMVIAISEQTKRDIVEFFNIAPEKVTVVYQGCDTAFHQEIKSEKTDHVKKKWNLPEKFILCVGTIEHRKNQLLIVKALKNLKPELCLVLVGKPKSYKSELQQYINNNGLAERVTFLENIPFEDLPYIYHSASIFVYPSFFEGFGIPILEALNCGVPVIGATGSCLEEAGGPDSVYVDPNDSADLVQKINLIFENEQLRLNMIKEGRTWAEKFREPVIAANLMTVYKETLNNAQRRN